MVMSQAATDQVKALAAELAAMRRRITQLERNQNTAQLAFSAIENDSLIINDGQQNPQQVIGLQPDGTFAHVSVTDTPPPQAPSVPVVTPAVLSAMVAWDGNQGDGSNPLADFAGCQVHCSAQPAFTPGPNTLQSTFIAAGVRPIGGLLAGETYYICTMIVNQAGLTGPPSPVVPVVPNSAVSPGQVIQQPVLIESTTLGYATSTPRGPQFYDFEFGLQGFGLDTGCTCVLSTDPSTSFTGAQSALITCDGLTWPVAIGPQIPVVAGDPVWVQFIYQASINLGATFVGIRWYDANGNLYNESDVGPAPITGEPGQWWAFSVGDIAQQAGYVRVVFGDEEVPPAGTQVWFDAVEVAGNLGFSFSAVTGADPEGNVYDQGITVYGQPGLQTAIAIKDPYGQNTNGSIDGQGNMTGPVLSGNTDIYMAGQSFTNDILPTYPQGLTAWVGIPVASLPFPASMSAVNTEIDLWELDMQTGAGREYMLVIDPFLIVCSTANITPTIQVAYTTDGSAPTSSSPIFSRMLTSTGPGSAVRTPPFIHRFSSASGLLYRFYLFLLKNGSSGYQIQTNGESTTADSPYNGLNVLGAVYDMGLTGPQTGSVILATAGGSAPTPKQTYTKTYNIVHTYCYQGSDGGNPNLKIDTDGTAYQGGDRANTYNGRAKTWFQLPTAMASDLSGATINWAKMYLNNNHSWYNSGMTLSLAPDNKSSWGGSAGDPSTSGYIHVAFSEGQAKWFTLGSGFYATLRDPAHNSLVAWAGSTSLAYYGFFAGAGQSGRPQLQINYTK